MRRRLSASAARPGRWRPTWWRAGLAGPGRRAAVGVSRSGGLRAADRSAGRGVDRLPVDAGRAPAPTCCRSSTPGPAACRRHEFDALGGAADGADRRGACGRDIPTCRSSAFRAALGRRSQRYVGGDRASQGVGCDTGMQPEHMADLARAQGVVVQGNLDPLLLVAGGAALERQVGDILSGAGRACRTSSTSGHGIVPETPPENVARLVELVRSSTGSVTTCHPRPERSCRNPCPRHGAQSRAQRGGWDRIR